MAWPCFRRGCSNVDHSGCSLKANLQNTNSAGCTDVLLRVDMNSFLLQRFIYQCVKLSYFFLCLFFPRHLSSLCDALLHQQQQTVEVETEANYDQITNILAAGADMIF